LQDLFIFLLLWLFYGSLSASWRAAPVRSGTGYIIRPSSGIGVLGLALLVLGPVACWLVVTTFRELRHDAMAHWIAITVATAVAVLGLAVLFHANRFFVFFNERGIVTRTTFGRFRHLAWVNVQSVQYQDVRGRLVFRSKRVALPVGTILRGFSSLLAQVAKSLPPAICATLMARLEKDVLRNEYSGEHR
jgi:hypothetical protein